MKSMNYSVVSSLCALAIGVLLVSWPGDAVNYLIITIGVLFLLPGLYGLFAFFASSRRKEPELQMPFPIVALGSALLGLWLMIYPSFFVTILMYVLGVLLVFAGLNLLMNFWSLRPVMHISWGVYIIPCLILATGIVVLFNPFQAATVPFIVLGIASIVYGITDFFRLLRYHHRKNKNITDVDVIEE